MLLKRNKIDLPTLADIENAAAKSEANSSSIEDVMSALAELGELFAEQDDAIVELAGLIEDQKDQKEVKTWQKSTLTESKLA